VGLLEKKKLGADNENEDEDERAMMAGGHDEVEGPGDDIVDEGDVHSAASDDKEMMQKGKLIDDEERKTGAVEWRVYGEYLLGCGGVPFLLFLFVVSLCLEVRPPTNSPPTASTEAALFRVLSNKRQTTGSDAVREPVAGPLVQSRTGGRHHPVPLHLPRGTGAHPPVSRLLGSPKAMNAWQAGMAASLVALVRQFAWFKSALDCARQLHDRLLEAVIRAPMSFFFATPTGRIVTRFSKDQGTVDSEIPDMVSDFFLCLFSSVATLAVICGVLPWFLVPAVPVMAVYWWVMQNYRKASRGTTATALPAWSECHRGLIIHPTAHAHTHTHTHMHIHTHTRTST
jgi:ABC-type multidrug transport system fused ATPase/permease subunit